MFVQDNNKQNKTQQNSNTNQAPPDNQAVGGSVQAAQMGQPDQLQQSNQVVQPQPPSQEFQPAQAGDTSSQTSQTTDQTQEDYVNSYEPPPKQADGVDQTQEAVPPSQEESQSLQRLQPQQPSPSKQTVQPSQSQPLEQPEQPQPPEQPDQPPQSDQPQKLAEDRANEVEAQSLVSEKLEDQNIFFLLGVESGTSEEKERFLDELQQVIWEDFLENDLDLLITTQEKEQVDQILNNSELSDLDKQEQILNYLSKLIPDLEEIMLEKALELKQEMVKERVQGMQQYYAGKEEALAKINQAAQLFAQGKWSSGAKVLNQVSA